MLLDRHLPHFHVHRANHRVVRAHPEEAFDAAGGAQIHDPILRTIFVASRLPSRIKAYSQGRQPLNLPKNPSMRAVAFVQDWVALDERAPEEVVTAFVIEMRRWRPPKSLRIAASDFDSFDTPGHVKVAQSVSVRPYGAHRSLVSLEVRALATDRRTEDLLRIGWTLAVPLTAYAFDAILDAIQRKAEHLPPPPPPDRSDAPDRFPAGDARRSGARR